MAPDLVLAGNLLVDDLVFADGRTRFGEAGGAVLYAALGAVLWGARVGLVSVAGADYPPAALAALERRGVDLGGVRRLGAPGLRTWLLYEDRGRRVVHQLGRPAHQAVSPGPDVIPAEYGSARAFHVAPMPPESQRALIARWAEARDALVSLDPHEAVGEGNLAEWLGTLARVDAFFPGEDELALAGAAADPRAALARLGAGRLRIVAFKRGPGGGLLYDRRDGRFREWPGSTGRVTDPTGAGDAFAGGFLAGMVATGSVARAMERGAVSASFAIEDWGAAGLAAASPEEAERRRLQWFGAGARS